MARRNRSKDSTERVLSNNATAIRAVLGADEISGFATFSPQPLSQVEDYRVWHPEGDWRPPQTVFGNPARWRVSGVKGRAADSDALPSRIGGLLASLGRKQYFADPRRVVLCVRRRRRRAVLHALGKVGRGFGGKRLRKLTWRSAIGC